MSDGTDTVATTAGSVECRQETVGAEYSLIDQWQSCSLAAQ